MKLAAIALTAAMIGLASPMLAQPAYAGTVVLCYTKQGNWAFKFTGTAKKISALQVYEASPAPGVPGRVLDFKTSEGNWMVGEGFAYDGYKLVLDPIEGVLPEGLVLEVDQCFA